MRRCRIGFDGRTINDRYHGIGRYAFNLLEAMTRLQSDLEFVIYKGEFQNTRFDWNKLAERPNIELREGPKSLFTPGEQAQWARILRGARLDLFHSPFFTIPLLASSKMPIIHTVHDLIFDRNRKDMPDSWAYPYYYIMMQMSLNRANRTVVVSSSSAQDLGHYYRISRDRVVLASEGVDAGFRKSRTSNDLSLILQAYRVESPFILSVGARRPHKNYERLIDAYARLAPVIGLDLVIVGPPDARFIDTAQEKAKAHHLNGRIHWIDWVREDDLPALYRCAEMVVLPSLVEGFGLPALEAMASGTLVLAANNSSFPEILGEAGIFFDPYDVDQIVRAIQAALNSPEQKPRLTRLALARSHEFTWERAAETIGTVYAELLS